MNACHQSSPSWERGTMRSMVEREAQARAVDARHQTDLAKPFRHSASRSTTLRVVPLSQEGED